MLAVDRHDQVDEALWFGQLLERRDEPFRQWNPQYLAGLSSGDRNHENRPRLRRAGDDGQREPGIGPMYIDGELKNRVLELGGASVEPFDPTMPMISPRDSANHVAI